MNIFRKLSKRMSVPDDWKSNHSNEANLFALLNESHIMNLDENMNGGSKTSKRVSLKLEDLPVNEFDDPRFSTRRIIIPPNMDLSPPSSPLRIYKPKVVYEIKAQPPIIVENVENFKKLNENLLEDVRQDQFKIKVLEKNGAKIYSNSPEAYGLITEKLDRMKLNDMNVSWYSFENKDTKPIKVMVKGLHHSWQPSDIIRDLQSQRFRVLDVENKVQWKSKTPLDMFIVTFLHKENINRIYRIDYILNTKVKIESMRKNNLIPQCKRCQGYGHTQKYCGRQEKCVKCIGNHLTKDCRNLKEITKPQCCNCGGTHPANYRGCNVVKELQKIRSTNQNTGKPGSKFDIKNNKLRSQSSILKQIKKGRETNIQESLDSILNKLNRFDDRLNRIELSSYKSLSKPYEPEMEF